MQTFDRLLCLISSYDSEEVRPINFVYIQWWYPKVVAGRYSSRVPLVRNCCNCNCNLRSSIPCFQVNFMELLFKEIAGLHMMFISDSLSSSSFDKKFRLNYYGIINPDFLHLARLFVPISCPSIWRGYRLFLPGHLTGFFTRGDRVFWIFVSLFLHALPSRSMSSLGTPSRSVFPSHECVAPLLDLTWRTIPLQTAMAAWSQTPSWPV